MSFAKFLAAVENPDLRAVAEHWNHARGAKKMPAWSDIDPTAIGPQLPIIWSWKYDRETDLFTGRLAGDEIDAIFGKTMRGADMREFFKDMDYEAIYTRNRRVVTEPCLCHCTGLVLIHFGRYGIGERVVMPLAADGEHGDGVFGATVYYTMQRGMSESNGKPAPTGENVTFYPL